MICPTKKSCSVGWKTVRDVARKIVGNAELEARFARLLALVGSRRATRHLRIRALGATGQVAGAASY